MKKILYIIFILLTILIFNSTIAKAAKDIQTTDNVWVEGAMVRTVGFAGIRFVGKVNNKAEDNKYGIILAYGQTDVSDDFVIGGQINGKEVKNVEVATTDDKNMFYATIYDIPENESIQKVTARAYQKNVNNEISYANTVIVRSLVEISLDAISDPNETTIVKESTIVNNTVNYVTTNYKKIAKDRLGNLYIDNAVYETNHAKLGEQFIRDWNYLYNDNVTNYTASRTSNGSLAQALIDGQQASVDAFSKDSKGYRFFNDPVMGPKWRWLLEYINDVTSANSAMSSQIKALLGEIDSLVAGTWYAGFNVYGRICGFFMLGFYDIGMANYNWHENISNYQKILDYNHTVYADISNLDLVKIGESCFLPTKNVDFGYEFGWTNSDDFFAGDTSYLVTNKNLVFIGIEREITYQITYKDGNNTIDELTPNTYTIKSDDFNLPIYNKDGYLFVGWFTEDGSDGNWGDEVLKISKGSTGDLTYYAKTELSNYDSKTIYVDFVTGYSHYLDLSEKTPNSIINSKYTSDGKNVALSNSSRGLPSVMFNNNWWRIFLKWDQSVGAYQIVALTNEGTNLQNTYPDLQSTDFDYVIGAHRESNSVGYSPVSAITSGANIGKYVAFDKELTANDGTSSGSGTIGWYFLGDKNAALALVKEAEIITTKSYIVTEVGEEVDLLAAPVRDGYIFDGWCSDKELQEEAVKKANYFNIIEKYYAKYSVDSRSDDTRVNEAIIELENIFNELVIESDLLLTSNVNGCNITWSSNKTDIISNTGVFKRPYIQTTVALSALVTYGSYSHTIQLNVTAAGYKDLSQTIASSYVYTNYDSLDNSFFELHDIINCAFTIANENGVLTGTTYFSNVANYVIPRAQAQGVWVIMSIAPDSKWTIFANPDNHLIETLANNIVTAINTYGFDGVDLDWEYPLDGQYTWFTDLVRIVRLKVKANNSNHLVTTAIAGGMWQPPYYDLLNSGQYLDYINVMCYDLSSNSGQYQNALYQRSGSNDSTNSVGSTLASCSIDASVKLFKNTYGIPYSKLIIGMPFYGVVQKRTFDGSSYSAWTSNGTANYSVIKSYLNSGDYTYYFDDFSKVPYLLKNDYTTFISYDDQTSVITKCQYVIDEKLAGVMYWQFGADTTGELLEAIKVGLNK